ncbi:hypothetical protein [Solidesulfovibrio magneticus]|uniref:Uncharacterized protein n=1 Tax=Solidesulfovibrio magneticus (strain ATCC 700980 / DSM 13731 / RS-1) TaxID=573370 RepID=C4XJ37_SOLM1|nr:hypothetical protein [Solidesulfovibrio magneticus]BAH74201.1 hypothetical protein DMR_07100 [Solidesulfovibrio magneticus RS-1]
MEWIIAAALAGAVLAAAAIFVMKAKHRPGSVHGDFRFDRHKEGELSRRGLLDRTQWH